MPDQKPQTFANHARFHPPFHFFAAPIALAAVIATVIHLVREPSILSAELVLLMLAFTVTVFLTRVNALKVQNRVIRLEETLRMQRLLPAPLLTRVGGLTIPQFVALRFASDAELPSLVEQSLANNMTAKQIKQAITAWRPDYYRV